MKRLPAWIAVVTVLVLGSVARQQPTSAQADKPCGDPARQKIAINLVRRINTMQANQFPQTKKYQPMTGFPAVSIPPGFVAQLVTNAAGTEYVVSVKDTQSCSAAVFSDQEQIIYVARPL